MKNLIVHDENNNCLMLFQVNDDISYGDEAFNNAVDYAKENCKNPCSVYEIPDEIFEKFGLHHVESSEVTTITVENFSVVQTEAEKAGVYKATCEDCSACEYGCCLRYGGKCEGPDYCFHGNNNAYMLAYDGMCFEPILIIKNSKLEAEKVLKLMNLTVPENLIKGKYDPSLLSLKTI